MKLDKLSKYQFLIYLSLAFLITWFAQIIAYLYAHNNGLKITNEENFFHFRNLLTGNLEPGFTPYLLLFSFSFGPTIAGIVATALFKGKGGLVKL